MKICFLSDGSSVHIRQWVLYFYSRGHDISLITDQPVNIPGIKIFIIGKYETKFRIPVFSSVYQVIRKTLAINKLLKKINPDILHSHYVNIYGFLGALTGFYPHIATCHGSDLLVHPNRSKVERFFVKTALKHADVITLPSRQMKKVAVKYGAVEEKIYQVQYGIELNKIKPARHPANIINILCSRNLTPQYKIDLIIRAFAELVKKYPGIHLNILGDGPEKGHLTKLVNEQNLNKKVTFHGYVDHDRVFAFYESSHLYVTASPTDGLSISLLEALAGGLLAVVPENPSNAELKSMGFDLLLYDIANMERLVDHLSDAINTISNHEFSSMNNRELVKAHFDRTQNMKIIENIYRTYSL